MNEFLPWLNLLLLPIAYGVLSINARITRLEARAEHHAARLRKLDGIEA